MLCVCGWVRGEVQHLPIDRAGLLSCVGPLPFASVDRAQPQEKREPFFFFHRSTPTPSSSYRLSVGLDVGATVPGKSAPLVHGVYSLVHASQRLFASSSFITLLVANKPHIQRR
jgi:hypothetical protein